MNYYLKVLKNYVNFNGRARRSEYWYFVLFNLIISSCILFADMGFGTYDEYTGRGTLNSIYSLAVMLPSIAVAVRRMHDVGKSGWYALIPIYNIILAFTEGDRGENEYGPDPKGGSTINEEQFV